MDMKIHRRLNRKVGDQIYYKYSLDIPTPIMDELQWESGKDGTDLRILIKNGRMIVEKEQN